MPRLDADTWATIRAKREGTGAPFESLAKEFGVSKTAIVKRAKAEAWTDGKDLNPTINAKAYAKVLAASARKVTGGHQDGEDVTDTPPTAVQMLEAEAERRASVLLGHQEQARKVKAIVDAALDGEEETEVRADPANPTSPVVRQRVALSMDQRKDRADLAKKVADAVTLAQAIDRRAFGLNAGDKDPGDAVITVKRVKRTILEDERE